MVENSQPLLIGIGFAFPVWSRMRQFPHISTFYRLLPLKGLLITMMSSPPWEEGVQHWFYVKAQYLQTKCINPMEMETNWNTGRERKWSNNIMFSCSHTDWYHNQTCCTVRICAATCPRWKLSHGYATLKQLELTYEKHLLHVDASLFCTPRHENTNKSNARMSNSVIRKWSS